MDKAITFGSNPSGVLEQIRLYPHKFPSYTYQPLLYQPLCVAWRYLYMLAEVEIPRGTLGIYESTPAECSTHTWAFLLAEMSNGTHGKSVWW